MNPERTKPKANVTGHFLDSSRVSEVKRWLPVVTGLTTNPVIFQKDGVTDIPAHLENICQMVGPGFPVSVEIPYTKMTVTRMISLAEDYAARFPSNAVIKIPLTPDGKWIKVITALRKKDILVNATLGLTFSQLVLAADAGANFISLFWGRAQESREKNSQGPGPEIILESTLAYLMTRNHNDVRIIVGSIRTAEQVRLAFSLGAHIVTVTPEVLRKSFSNRRLRETIRQFDDAYLKASQDPNFKLV